MNRYRKSFASKRIGVKLLKRTGAYAFLMFAVCFAIFFFLNQLSAGAGLQNQQVNAGQTVAPSVAPASAITPSPVLTLPPAPTPTPTLSPTPPPAATPNPAAIAQDTIKITGVPGDAQIVFSYDDQYSSYLYKSQIVVIDNKEDKVIQTIKDNGIAWMNFLNNRDIVLYFTVQNNTLALDTYNIATGQAVNQMSINLPSGSKLKCVDDTSATNLIYIGIEQDSGGKTSDSVYYVNILKNLQQVPFAANDVASMVLLNKSNTLYSEDGQNNLYLNGKPFAGLKTGKLIGCDVNDNVYVQSVSKKNSISVITNQKMVGTITLSDPNVLRYYADKSNIYAVYSDYIINLYKDLNARLPYDKSLKFAGIGGAYAYFRNMDNTITALKLNI